MVPAVTQALHLQQTPQAGVLAQAQQYPDTAFLQGTASATFTGLQTPATVAGFHCFYHRQLAALME